MARILNSCEVCSKPLQVINECLIDACSKIISYKCGHSVVEILEPKKPLQFISVNGDKVARQYQQEGIDFIVNGRPSNENGFNAIIGDQMRLGKTPQSLLAAASDKTRRPILILVKSANLFQWLREYKTWTSSLPLGIFVIQGSTNFIPPGFDAYIISMDTFSSEGSCKCKHAMNRHDEITGKCGTKSCQCRVAISSGNAMSDQLLKFGFKLCIVDEAHSFKNTSSKRSQSLIAFLKEINKADLTHIVPFTCMMCRHSWDESVTVQINSMDATQHVTKRSSCPQCNASVVQRASAHVKVSRKCGVIMLTGTAIKNRADELFVPLNIVAPEKFPSLEHYRRSWLIRDTKNQWSRVNPKLYTQFKEAISPFYLRREKEDVYDSLPELNRMFTLIEISDDRLKKAYNTVLDKMEDDMNSKSNYGYFDSIGDLMILRQICGLAKVKWTADYVETMLMDSDKAKVAIGIHHHSVRDNLAYELAQFGVMKLSGEDSAERKDSIMTQFEHNNERVLILNMLAGGVGMDFHYVNNILILERQWSSADEEQFEFRFYNPDKSIKTAKTDIEYVVAKGTIDQWFYDMVEDKRKIFGETLGTNWSIQSDKGSFKDLVAQTIGGRL